MSDLISRKALIEELHKALDGSGYDEDYKEMGIDDFINNQPTSFDVEKVVEQLEDRKSYILKEFVLKDKAEKVKEIALSRMNEVDGCIDIVKRGGIDG